MTVSPETLRLVSFGLVLGLMALWELRAPARVLVEGRHPRWLTNFSFALIDTVVLRLVLPAGALGAASYAETLDFGLLRLVDLSPFVMGVLGFLLLDLAIYGQHVVFHKVPVLWRIHAVHHADRDLDVSSGLRFHPLEALLSMGLKMIVVFVLGVPVIAVFVFEVVLNAAAQFNHSNVTLPARIERFLRWMIVTPEMHRTHHSIDPKETDTNFGFFLSIWDRVFGLYTAEPARGREGLILGLAEHQTHGPSWLVWSILLPFRKGRRSA